MMVIPFVLKRADPLSKAGKSPDSWIKREERSGYARSLCSLYSLLLMVVRCLSRIW